MDSLKLLTRGGRNRSLQIQNHHDINLQSHDQINEHVEAPPRKKQKLFNSHADSTTKSDQLSSEQIRQVQKKHRIKITDLKTLHGTDKFEGHKSRKEESRVFPPLLQKFSELADENVKQALLVNLGEQGYREPTEVQLATIRLQLAQGDKEPNLLSVAPTGSGKTLAFLIPLIDKIRRLHTDVTASKEVKAIVLAPTRELASQTVNEARKLTLNTGVRVTLFKKGMKLHESIGHIDEGSSEESEDEQASTSTVVKADIVVATPLSLLHAITPSGSEDALALPHIENLVLDEADVLLDPLFRAQTISIWSACTSHALRVSLWSATVGSNVEDLMMSTIETRQKALKIKAKSVIPLLRCIVGLKDSSLPNISHKLIYATTEAGKLTGIRQLIRPAPANIHSVRTGTNTPSLKPPFLIFAQSIPRAEALYDELKYDIPPPMTSSTNGPGAEPVSRIAILHSSLSSNARSKIMQNFRLGKIWILITTDLLSRGIDFRGINGVVNYDIPTTSASYVHRAGRTGRAGREGSTCITFYTRDDVQYLRPIANVISKSRKQYETGDTGSNTSDEIPSWLLDALPHLTKNTKRDLKERGVDVRRAVKESDDKLARRRKGRNAIGTKSGYEKKIQDRRKGAIEGSRRRRNKQDGEFENGNQVQDAEDFGGFD